VVPVTGDDGLDVATWSNAIESAPRDREAEFGRVAARSGRGHRTYGVRTP
jgi:hypothetical protein